MVSGPDSAVLPPPPRQLSTDAAAVAAAAAHHLGDLQPVDAVTLAALTDHTTLNATDTPAIIQAHCDTAAAGPLRPKAVCVTPDYVAFAVEQLANTGVHVASVAGAFPHGRTLKTVRQHEITAVLDAGANELDIVLDRARFLAGDHQTVFDDIRWVRQICDTYRARDGKQRHLKVILETGELGSLAAIHDAAWLVLTAGADLVKTSTGTIPAGAEPSSVLLIAQVVHAFNEQYGTRRGVKISGGMRTIDHARRYFTLVHAVFGPATADPYRLRFGASRLLAALRESSPS